METTGIMHFKQTKNDYSLFRNIGIVVDPLILDVGTNFLSSFPLIILVLLAVIGVADVVSFLGALLFNVDTFPPLLVRRLFGPTILVPEKSAFGGGTIELMFTQNLK